MSGVVHLTKRFVGSLSRRPPSPDDERWAAEQLLAGELVLWRRLSNVDRRHAIEVARRFGSRRADASRDELAAALLHDVGKLDSGLGTFARVLATIVGPRTRRFRRYHAHEQLGVEMLRAAGSSDVTVELAGRHGPAAAALAAADHI